MSPLFVALPATVPPSLAVEHPASAVVAADPAPAGWTRVRVGPGETVWDLAVRHRSTVSVIVARNDLGPAAVVRPGEHLWVPRSSGASPVVAPGRTASHVVGSGETLWDIAQRYRVTVSALVRANGLADPGSLRVGQRLSVPGAGSATRALPSSRTAAAKRPAPTGRHTVAAGETLSDVAARYGSTVARLAKANGIADPRALRVGRRLVVPARASAAPSDLRATFAGRTYGPEIVGAAAENRARLAATPVPSRSEARDLIIETARRYGVDPRLALAIAWQESGWNQRRVSVANAVGTMQVIPSSGAWASQLAGRDLDLRDARDNITAGVVILRVLTRSAASSDDAIAGYYQGLASVQAHGMYADTRGYVAAVNAHRARM